MSLKPQTATETMDLVADLSVTQQTVLEVLAGVTRPLNVTEIAERVQLHSNTVREVLTQLLQRDLVTRERAAAGGRGRPFWLYRAHVNMDPKQIVRAFANFGAAVAIQIQDTVPDPAGVARAVGHSWGKQILGDDHAAEVAGNSTRDASIPKRSDAQLPTDQPENAAEIRRFLSRLGFEAREGQGWAEINLHQCPLLREGAQISPIVCEIHQGMTDEVVAGLTSNRYGSHLTPFAGSGYCQVLLLPQAHPTQ